MRILVTGGAGFLGSHLCEKLLSLGHSVLAVDNFYTGDQKNIAHLRENRDFELLRHDVTFPLYVEVDGIFNLACPASPIHYQRNPVQTFKTSVHGAINMLGLAKRTGARFFQASTSEIYGDPTVSPQPEEYWGNVNPIGIRSCYDEGKRAAETLTFDYHRQFGLDIRVARIFNTYGPRQSARAVIPTIISQLATGREVKLGSLSPTRDFSFVQDTANGFLAAAMSDAIVGQTVNLGSGFEISIQETAETIAKLMNVELKLANDEQRVRPESSEVERLHASIQKAKEVLGWQPQLKGLEGFKAGLKQTIDWFSNPTNLARYKADRYNL